MHACGFLDTCTSFLRCPTMNIMQNESELPAVSCGLESTGTNLSGPRSRVPDTIVVSFVFLELGGMPGRSAAPRRPERLPSSKDAPCRLVPFRAELHNSILRFVSGLLSCDACRVMHVGPSASCGSHVMIESPTRTGTCRHGASFVIVGTCNGPTTGGRKLNPSRLAHRGRHRECCCP